MILQMAADVRQVDGARDSQRAQLVGRADARQHQQARRIDRPGAEQDFGLGPHDPSGQTNAEAPAALDLEAEHLGAGEQIDLCLTGTALQTVEIGGRGVVARVTLDAELVPPDARREFAAQVRRHRKSRLLRARHEGFGDRRAVRDVGQRQHMQGPAAAAPGTGAAREGLGAPEIGQEVGVTPARRPAVVGRRMTALVGQRIDDARTAHRLAARTGDRAAAQPRLRRRLVSPVQRALLEAGPGRRVCDGRQVRAPADLDQEHPPPGPPQPMRQNAACRSCADDHMVIGRAELLGRRQDADAGGRARRGRKTRKRDAAGHRGAERFAALQPAPVGIVLGRSCPAHLAPPAVPPKRVCILTKQDALRNARDGQADGAMSSTFGK